MQDGPLGKEFIARVFADPTILRVILTQFSCNHARTKRNSLLPLASPMWLQETRGEEWGTMASSVDSHFGALSSACKTVASIVYLILTGDHAGMLAQAARTDVAAFEWSMLLADYKRIRDDTRRLKGRVWMVSLGDTAPIRQPPPISQLLKAVQSGRLAQEDMLAEREKMVRAAGSYTHKFVISASPTGIAERDWQFQIYSAFEYGTYTLPQWLNTGGFEVSRAGDTPVDVARSPYRNTMNLDVFREFMRDLFVVATATTCTPNVSDSYARCFGDRLDRMIGQDMGYSPNKRMAFTVSAADFDVPGFVERARALTTLVRTAPQ